MTAEWARGSDSPVGHLVQEWYRIRIIGIDGFSCEEYGGLFCTMEKDAATEAARLAEKQ